MPPALLAVFSIDRRVGAPGRPGHPDYAAIVAAPDRSDADRQTDQRRQPDKMLAFAGVKTGMKVLDMEANAGYSTELLARAVGPTAWSTRRIRRRHRASSRTSSTSAPRSPAMKNVVHVVRNFDDPIPPEVGNLDMITFFFAYHDVDLHAGRPRQDEREDVRGAEARRLSGDRRSFGQTGEGITVAKTLHRIEETR